MVGGGRRLATDSPIEVNITTYDVQTKGNGHSEADILSSWPKLLYNFDRFVGHAPQGVPDVPKYGRCHS